MSGDSWNLSIVNEFQWIASSGIFSDWSIKVVDFSGLWVKCHIFQNGTELDGIVDLWLLLGAQIYAFSVTTTFDVENSFFCPNMFVITNEFSVSNCRKCSFTGSWEAKKQTDVSCLTNIAAWMERKMAFLWHEVIHDGENSFFHFASILGSKNDHFSLLEIQCNTSIAINIGNVFVGMELSSVEDIIVGAICEVSFQLLCSWFNQHVIHEKGMIWPGTDNSNANSFFLVEACITIDNVKSLSCVEIVSGQVLQNSKWAGSHWNVDIAPSNFLLTDRISDNSFGARGSSKLLMEENTLFWNLRKQYRLQCLRVSFFWCEHQREQNLCRTRNIRGL